jgi:hypothetical protein
MWHRIASGASSRARSPIRAWRRPPVADVDLRQTRDSQRSGSRRAGMSAVAVVSGLRTGRRSPTSIRPPSVRAPTGRERSLQQSTVSALDRSLPLAARTVVTRVCAVWHAEASGAGMSSSRVENTMPAPQSLGMPNPVVSGLRTGRLPQRPIQAHPTGIGAARVRRDGGHCSASLVTVCRRSLVYEAGREPLSPVDCGCDIQWDAVRRRTVSCTHRNSAARRIRRF